VRSLLIIFHRWLALATSVLVIIAATTGAILVFEGAIDRARNPTLLRVTPAGVPLSLDTLAARAAVAALSEAEPLGPVTSVSLPAAPDRAVAMKAGSTEIFLDPYTGRVQGTRTEADEARGLPHVVHELHSALLAGDAGRLVVTGVSFVSLLLTLSGAMIWWRDKAWRVRWSGSWKRIAYDLHHTLGIGLSLVVCIITASGVILHSGRLDAFIRRINAVESPPARKQSIGDGAAVTIPLDAVVRAASMALPGAKVTWIQVPPERVYSITVGMQFPEDHSPGGRSIVTIDRFLGTPLEVASTRKATTGVAISNQMRAIHTGDVYGVPTALVWCLASLVLASQAVTGFVMWWNARAARAAASRRASGPPPNASRSV
jgi:uncharacterized iron-regulated membrane protein